MTSDPSLLSHVQPCTGNDSIIVGNGNQLPISHIGKTTLSCFHGSLVLHDVLYVPAITKNLLSIQRFSRDNNCYFEMDYNGFRVKDNKKGKILLIGSSHGDLYYICADPQVRSKLVFYGERTTQDVWHARLGHPSSDILRVLARPVDFLFLTVLLIHKSKADGTIERHKARLVAKGYNQKEGFDYYETFSHVVKPATIRTILALAVSQNWILQQLDVRNAFLNGPNASVINTFIDKLCSTFASRKLGALHFFLGMEVTRYANQLSLSQARYASDLLKKFKMDLCKPCPTSLFSSQRLSAHDGDSLSDPETYCSMVGGLQYLTLSRLDIAYAINQVCQYMHNPKTTHLQAVKRICRYIKGTIEHGLVYHSSPDYILRAFSDADYIGPALLTAVVQLVGHASSLVPMFSPGPPKSNPPSLGPAQKPSVKPLLQQLLNFSGFVIFSDCRQYFCPSHGRKSRLPCSYASY
ncbi:hypothetical protein L3X38_003615 [Prunus dulcis]|uniref:Reverse transcriptase Ty1/copia-type domain-containing protein n=1 Tax=Prunus dulcis TaxID=3755 RepID=A0AAD4ZMG6_PRUDU|nr:hypothetical protein L3X38_003615 [Prunus dulcis]